MNRVFLQGRLGKDPEIKHFQNDSAIANFTIATEDGYKNKEGDWVKQTEWHNVKLPFKYMAELAEKYLKKGDRVLIEGKLQTRSYDDRDGNKRYVTEVVAVSMELLGDKKQREQNEERTERSDSSSNSGSSSSGASNNNWDDDLPFALLALFTVGSLMSYLPF